MNVKELIEKLETFDPESRVLVGNIEPCGFVYYDSPNVKFSEGNFVAIAGLAENSKRK